MTSEERQETRRVRAYEIPSGLLFEDDEENVVDLDKLDEEELLEQLMDEPPPDALDRIS